MPLFSDFKFWIPVVLLLFWKPIQEKDKGLFFYLLAVAVFVGFTDFLSSKILKEFFARPRPYNFLENVNFLAVAKKSFSFPSSHAVNLSTAVFLLTKKFEKLKILLFVLLALVCFSRIYIGVHYFLDVFCGVILGFVLAKIFEKGMEKIEEKSKIK